MEKSINEIKCQNCKAEAKQELKPIESKLYDIKLKMAGKTFIDNQNYNPSDHDWTDDMKVKNQLIKEKNDIIEKCQNCLCNN